jgi:hypothetical protein
VAGLSKSGGLSKSPGLRFELPVFFSSFVGVLTLFLAWRQAYIYEAGACKLLL